MLRVLKYEESQINNLLFWVSIVVPVVAYFVVVYFLGGSPTKDAMVFSMAISSIAIRLFEKRLGRYAKYLYLSIMPLWGAVVLVYCNDGMFVSMTHAYLLWLFLGTAYYEVSAVKWCVIVTIVANVTGMIINVDAYLKIHKPIIWGFNVFLYVIAVICAVSITKRSKRLLEMEERINDYENELSFYEALQEKDEKHGEFIHNIVHYLMAIGEMAKEHNHENILGLIKELNVELEHSVNIVYTYHKVVNVILSEKRGEAERKEILFDVQVEQGCRFGQISDGDLVAMLGNLLDNALQAAGKCEGEQRWIKVRMYMENQGRVCVVKIVNPYIGKLLKNRNGFVSTKTGDGIHGVGIKSVGNMAEKYGGYLECLTENQMFTSVLVLHVEK